MPENRALRVSVIRSRLCVATYSKPPVRGYKREVGNSVLNRVGSALATSLCEWNLRLLSGWNVHHATTEEREPGLAVQAATDAGQDLSTCSSSGHRLDRAYIP